MPTPLRDLKTLAAGEPFHCAALLRSRTVKTAKNAVPYLQLEFADKSGAFTATVFTDHPDYATLLAAEEGSPMLLDGCADTFADRFSPKLTVARVLTPADPAYADALDGLVECSPENLDALHAELRTHIDALAHPILRASVAAVFAEVDPAFRTSAAAMRMHHAYRGGLLEHTVHMARAARALLPLYPEIHADLALAGILLHDTGKVLEYSQGRSTRMTRAGILHGHLVLGYSLVRDHARRLGLEPAMRERLEHILLSHHGELAWGAVTVPATPEAVFVSLVDNLDAKLGMVQQTLRQAPTATEFSEKHPGLGTALLLTRC